MSDKYFRTKWFRDSRFGMFIHWGLYAIPSRGEWVRSHERISKEDYQIYFDEFNPNNYKPKEWAKLAKAAGMKYAVLTAKHHDGFCLYDSKLTDYKSTNTLCKRDLVKEFLEAFRAEGIKVGLYYSLLDWHHPDYPIYEDAIHPMRGNDSYKEHVYEWDRYLTYMHAQVKELCSNYGKLDILWFDFSYDNMANEKWKAKELVEMVRNFQPDVIIDNRLETSGEGFGSLITKHPNSWSGDFVSPEQLIPHEGILDCDGNPVPWEACITMNNHWGYCSGDNQYKSSTMIIRKLVECVSKNGNLILNVGPDANGNIPEQSKRILKEVGMWMKKNHESIYECMAVPVNKPEWGRYTKKENIVYVHIFEAPIGPLALTGIPKDKIKSIRLLRDKSVVRSGESWVTKAYEGIPFVRFGDIEHFTYPLPDQVDTVLEIHLNE